MSIAEIVVSHLPYIPANSWLPSVLVVEDQRKVRDSLVDAFRGMNIEALTASGGYEAIRIASDCRPDLILVDGLLPEMHGFEISRFIRRIDGDYHPHIALMTAIYKHTRYQNEAKLKYGIDDYLIKPVSAPLLAGLVRRVQAEAP
jgi:DNA-binding response OmpR family regulator